MAPRMMTIYSWNMLFRNQELDRAFSFIESADFDFFCLQEVPEHFLKRLAALPCSMASCVEATRIEPETVRQNFNVILSKHPITAQGDFSFPDYWPLLPFRSRLFIRFMRLMHFTKTENRAGLYADAEVRGQKLRIFNLHLILAHPSWRLKEFEIAMMERDNIIPTIVCGDFNIIESPLMSALNWCMGGTVGDALFYTRERTRIEQRFVEHQLTNPLRGTITHPLSRSQLDHILLSPHLLVQEASVIPERYGSDHNPIRVTAAAGDTTPALSSRP